LRVANYHKLAPERWLHGVFILLKVDDKGVQQIVESGKLPQASSKVMSVFGEVETERDVRSRPKFETAHLAWSRPLLQPTFLVSLFTRERERHLREILF